MCFFNSLSLCLSVFCVSLSLLLRFQLNFLSSGEELDFLMTGWTVISVRGGGRGKCVNEIEGVGKKTQVQFFKKRRRCWKKNYYFTESPSSAPPRLRPLPRSPLLLSCSRR